MTNEELIAEIKAGNDPTDNILQLYIQNHGIIFLWCKPFSAHVDMADLIQESFLAVYDAVNDYDDSQGAKFLTFLRYAMLNHFRSIVRNHNDLTIPAHFTDMIREYKKMRDSYILTLGKEPPDSAYCRTLRITYKELTAIRKNMNTKARSLSEPILLSDGEEIQLQDTIAADDSGIDAVLDEVEKEELREIIDRMLGRLPEEQKKVILMRFYNNFTLRECAERTGIAAETIRRTELKAIRQLRNQSDNIKILREFVTDQEVYDLGMVHQTLASFLNTRESSTEKAAFRLSDYRDTLRRRNNFYIADLSGILHADDKVIVST